MRTHKIWLCLLLFAAPMLTFAQTRIVKGKVTDAKDGTPLAEATVSVIGQPTTTKTGTDGTFSFSVPTAAKQLRISYVGYTDRTVSIPASGDIDVTLDISSQNLTEVVVIGYGTSRKKDITGAVASLKPKDFNQGQIAAPDQLLQNKVAGLEVTNTSGQPGVASTVQIRGTSSIRSGNNPLYVVDGVPLDGGTPRPNLGTTFGSTANSNPLLYIDPNSIGQVEVLKDAASAAIYGARGANGVIVITTKKATPGPSKVEFGANFGVNAGFMKRFEVLDAGQFRDAIKKYNQPNTLDGGQNVDALKEITQPGFTQNYSLAFSGGNDVGRFRASFLGSKIDGFIKNTSLEKYLATIGGNYRLLDKKLTLDFNLIAGNYGETLTSTSNTAGSTGNIISSALSWNPTQSLRNAQGLYVFPTTGSGNPLAFNDAYGDKSSQNVFLASGSANYAITGDLDYKFLYGINYGRGRRLIDIDGWLQGFPDLSGRGFAAIGDAQLRSQTITHTLSYNKDITGDLDLNAVVGYEYYKTDYQTSFMSASGFKTNLDQTTRTDIPYTSIMQNAQTQNPYQTFVNPTAELQSFFGRVILNYKGRYILTGSVRRDGSSKFGANNRYGNFPAAGAKWMISSEEFMRSSTVFSNLALRASWGITGNQEFPAGASREQFRLETFQTFPQIVNGNPNLKWESTASTNIGVDWSIVRGKIYGSVDYYKKTTSDILFQTNAIQPAPASISFVNLPDAKLINEGVEIAVGADLVTNERFGWDVNLNLAINNNKIVDFKDPNTGKDNFVQTGQINGQGVSGTLAQVITNNQPVNAYYLKPFNGFDGNGNQQIGNDPQFAGDPNPGMLYGFSTSLRYNRWNLAINMGGAADFLIYNNTATSVTNIAGIAQGRNIDLAAYNSPEKPSSGVGASTRFLEKGDYIKLRNMALRYNLGSWGEHIKNFSAFVSATNLFVITGFTGFDPEVNIDKSNNSYPSRSIEYVPYPTPRTINFGVNFNL